MKIAILTFVLCNAVLAAGFGPCTAHDLNGTYAFMANGSVLVPGAPISGPFSRIGSLVFDGAGKVKASTLALYNGINFGVESFPGTYTVTSDCALTLNMLVPAPIFANVEFKGQVAMGGNDLTFMLVNTDNPQAPPITTVVGFGRKRSPFVNWGPAMSCSSARLVGHWRVEVNGFRNLPPTGTGTPFRLLGNFDLDGKGGMTTSMVLSDNGSISSATPPGTYNVASDCSVDLNFSLGDAPFSIRGSIIDAINGFAAFNVPGPTVPLTLGPVTIQAVLTGAVGTGSMVRESIQP